MRTVVLAGTKGGCGKTSLAFATGIRAALEARVYFADVDPQHSLIDMCQRRAEDIEGDNPCLLEGVESIIEAKRRLHESGFLRDYLIVDTPGSFVDIIADAVAAADVVIVPVLASPLDILAQEAVSRIITELHKSAVTLMVLNKIDRRSKIIDEAMELIVPMFPNKPVWISHRVSYVRGAVAGLSPAEIDKGAKGEIDALWTGIQKILRNSHNEKTQSRQPKTRQARRPARRRKERTEGHPAKSL